MARFAQNPRVRAPISDAQKELLSRRQKEYIANDPRWEQHRAKLSQSMKTYTAEDPRFPEHCKTASERQRWRLFQEEIAAAKELLQRGRNFEYISETLCVSDNVLRRELKAAGIDPTPARSEKRARRGSGFWRCFDPP